MTTGDERNVVCAFATVDTQARIVWKKKKEKNMKVKSKTREITNNKLFY